MVVFIMERDPEFGIKSLLFLSSYSPAWLILALKFYGHNYTVVFKDYRIPLWIFPLLLLICSTIALLIKIQRPSRGYSDKKILIIEFSSLNPLYIEYLITYIFPFVVIQGNSNWDVLSLVILFVLIWWIYINSNLLYVNPTLGILGYNIFRVMAKPDEELPPQEYILITKQKKLLSLDEITTISLSQNILLDVRDQYE